jgi:hypothetical protein
LDCIPEEACPLTGIENATICKEGYTGYICGECIKLQYFRLETKCLRCNSAPVFMWIILAIIVVLFLFIGFKVTQASNRVPFVCAIFSVFSFLLTYTFRIFESPFPGFRLYHFILVYRLLGQKKYWFLYD